MPTALVVGASRGIGLELARQLQATGSTVYATCRTATPELKDVGCDVIEGIDVSDRALGAHLATSLKGVTLDLLIHNAGIMKNEALAATGQEEHPPLSLTGPDAEAAFDSLEEQMRINALGPVRVVAALIPNLTAGSKVALISTRMASIADNSGGGRYGYRMSKAALNMAGVNLAHDLQKSPGALLSILHPGFVETDLNRHLGAKAGVGPVITPQQSAQGILTRISEMTLENNASFRHAVTGEVLPW